MNLTVLGKVTGDLHVMEMKSETILRTMTLIYEEHNGKHANRSQEPSEVTTRLLTIEICFSCMILRIVFDEPRAQSG